MGIYLDGIFGKEFLNSKRIAFEILMFLAIAHFFGFYNPKQLADFLGVPHQGLYRAMKEWSTYYLKEMLICFMVRQAAEKLKPVLEKSDATISRAGITIAVDNSVIDRPGKLLRCTWSWYSGRSKKVVNGSDLLGIVMTVCGVPYPLHLLFLFQTGPGIRKISRRLIIPQIIRTGNVNILTHFPPGLTGKAFGLLTHSPPVDGKGFRAPDTLPGLTGNAFGYIGRILPVNPY